MEQAHVAQAAQSTTGEVAQWVLMCVSDLFRDEPLLRSQVADGVDC